MVLLERWASVLSSWVPTLTKSAKGTKWSNKNPNFSCIFPQTSHKTFSMVTARSPPTTGVQRTFLHLISENFMIGGQTVQLESFENQTPLPHRKFFVRTPEFDLSPRGSNLRFSLTSARFFRGFGFNGFDRTPQKSGQAHMGRYESNKFTICTKLSDLCSSPNFKIDL